VYWVHVMIVYGALVRPIKRALSAPMAGVAAVVVTLLMVGMSGGWIWWKGKRAGQKNAPPSPPVLNPARTEG